MKYLLFITFSFCVLIVGCIVMLFTVANVSSTVSNSAEKMKNDAIQTINSPKPQAQAKTSGHTPIDSDDKTHAATDSDNKLCLGLSNLAMKIMTARQNNVPQEEFDRLHSSHLESKASAADLHGHQTSIRFSAAIVPQAYKMPVMESPQEKEALISEFKQRVYEMCVVNEEGH